MEMKPRSHTGEPTSNLRVSIVGIRRTMRQKEHKVGSGMSTRDLSPIFPWADFLDRRRRISSRPCLSGSGSFGSWQGWRPIRMRMWDLASDRSAGIGSGEESLEGLSQKEKPRLGFGFQLPFAFIFGTLDTRPLDFASFLPQKSMPPKKCDPGKATSPKMRHPSRENWAPCFLTPIVSFQCFFRSLRRHGTLARLGDGTAKLKQNLFH